MKNSGGYDIESGQYNQNGFCVVPYTGNKCDECIEGYAHFGSKSLGWVMIIDFL